MSETVDKIQRIILESEVEEHDKGLIFDLLGSLDESALADILILMEKGIVGIGFFQKLWLEKKEAIATGQRCERQNDSERRYYQGCCCYLGWRGHFYRL